jgi:glycosyltransferase involved in cell wall biosynthesis
MLSIVIPYYNDAGCPIPFVTELKKELNGIDYEIILVDDCSKDSTPKELDSLKEKRVKIIKNKKNKDYGGAIIEGLNNARGDILGFTCGDGEISPKEIVRVYNELGNYDIIKSIRKNREDGLNRKFISFVFNIWSRMRFGIKLRDINGYPVYFKREVYKNLKDLREDWIFNTDFFRKAIAKKYSIKEVIITHKKRSHGKSKMVPKRIIKMIVRFIRYK